MNIFFHFSITGFSNSYLIGGDEGGDAVLVDPGVMDKELLNLIEENGYYVRYVLLTHRHDAHVGGIRIINRIYQTEVYANTMTILDSPVHSVSDGEEFFLGDIRVKAIQVPGHSSDSLVYQIGNALFTGDVLLSGKIGSTTTELSRSLLIRSIMEKLFNLNESCMIFPGHGPPSTLKAEKFFNPDIHLGLNHGQHG